MKFNQERDLPPEDTWVWGIETLLWGYQSDHQYTLKILRPKVGREGCLSLQYHHEKSESWFVLSGTAWALMIQGDKVITRLMTAGDYQNLPAGTVHRLMGLTDDVKVLEASTPDAHAADKDAVKDVIRLHCVFGRECEQFEEPAKQALVNQAIAITEESIAMFDGGEMPQELELSSLVGAGSS